VLVFIMVVDLFEETSRMLLCSSSLVFWQGVGGR
jgi:hypothetical protein